MSTLQRQTTWASLQTLTATALNGEFNNIVNGWNNHDAGVSRWTVMDATTLKRGGTTLFPILQVVTFTTATGTTTTSTSFVDTILVASITPGSTSNKILVFASGTLSHNTGGFSGCATIARGSTDLSTDGNGLAETQISATVSPLSPTCMFFLDSPASSSSVTYKVRIKTMSGAGTTTFGNANAKTQVMMLVELGY